MLLALANYTATTIAPAAARSGSGTHWAAGGTAAATAALALAAIYAARQVTFARRSLTAQTLSLQAQTLSLQAQTSRDLWAGWANLIDARQLAASYPSPADLRTNFEETWRTKHPDFYKLCQILDYFEQVGVLFETGARPAVPAKNARAHHCAVLG